MTFPDGFVWGAAAASYQIEGAAYEDGKGLSVWDVMCRTRSIADGGSGDEACDHYHRYRQDVGLMREVGLGAYRLSLSWPRVLPEGIGRVNERGLDFYERLVDELLAQGIEPWVTLFHWDYPYELYLRGGWLHPDCPAWFAEYARVVVERLSDRVRRWMTLNEPQVFITLGHLLGTHAPALRLPRSEALRASHHVNLAHGQAVQALRQHARQPLSIGAAPVGITMIPDSDSPHDIEAARGAMFGPTDDTWSNALFSDPWILGSYPDELLARFGRDMPAIGSGDMDTIRQPLDFFGFNNYHGQHVTSAEPFDVVPPARGSARTMMDWQVTPEALYWGPKFFYERYGLPLIITENGMANTDWIHADGKVHDPQRIDFVSRYLDQYRRAIAEGVKAEGYFLWSIMDNFEWAEGYRKRFGLIFVDYSTQRRVLKDSAHWYRRVIETNGACIDVGRADPRL